MKEKKPVKMPGSGFKWFYRYVLYALFPAASIFWCVYCIITLGQLNVFTESAAYIDMTINSFLEAQAVLERIRLFEGMLLWSVIISVVLLAGLVLMVIYQVKWSKVLQKKAEAKAQKRTQKKAARAEKAAAPAEPAVTVTVPAEPEAPAEEPAAKRAAFCPHCGTRHEGSPKFCAQCGKQISE